MLRYPVLYLGLFHEFIRNRTWCVAASTRTLISIEFLTCLPNPVRFPTGRFEPGSSQFFDLPLCRVKPFQILPRKIFETEYFSKPQILAPCDGLSCFPFLKNPVASLYHCFHNFLTRQQQQTCYIHCFCCDSLTSKKKKNAKF